MEEPPDLRAQALIKSQIPALGDVALAEKEIRFAEELDFVNQQR